MISKLRGILDSIMDQAVIIDVGGVGYQVHCSHRCLNRLPALGEPIVLLTELIVREDAFTLLGFLSGDERDFYRLLILVQGVGMRVALSLLSLGEPDEIAHAIQHQDKTYIGRADGVGPKLAARIINELKERIVKRNAGIRVSLPYASAGSSAPSPSVTQDALSALMNLGYKQNDALEAIDFAVREQGDDAKIEALIRTSLVRLAR